MSVKSLSGSNASPNNLFIGGNSLCALQVSKLWNERFLWLSPYLDFGHYLPQPIEIRVY
ncbi:MAG TPA: hypothetical protein PLO56_03735 [Rhodothermales bacterium]|nr:hypothetical protein [Rhodothermales bacterium]